MSPPAFAMEPDYFPSIHDEYIEWVRFAQWFNISPMPASKAGIKAKVRAVRDRMLAHKARKNTGRGKLSKWRHHPLFDGYTAVAQTGANDLVELMVLVMSPSKFRATYRRSTRDLRDTLAGRKPVGWIDVDDFGTLAEAKAAVREAV